VRRFAAEAAAEPAGTIRAGAAATVGFRADRAEQPWRLRLTPQGAVAVCGLDAASPADGPAAGPD
jgi:hypothetical protein